MNKDKPILFIRADASPSIGTGHIMRCIALGQAWEEIAENGYRGPENEELETKNQEQEPRNKKHASAHVVFICAELPEKLEERLRKEGFAVERITATPGSEADAQASLDAVRRYLSDRERSDTVSPNSSFILPLSSFPLWFVLDGYQFDVNYHRAIRSAGLRLMVIDDYNHLPEYECDLLLNQNMGAEEYQYKINAGAKLLLGIKYVLLRREFRDAAKRMVEFEPRKTLKSRIINSSHWNNENKKFQSLEKSGDTFPMFGKKVLVTMGGADTHNVTTKVLEALNRLVSSGLEVKAVLGASNPWLGEVERKACQSRHKIEILRGADNMAALMLWADFAITAAGSTCWELCCLGTPMILTVTAENQSGIARGLDGKKAILHFDYSNEKQFGGQIEELLKNGVLRCVLGRRSRRILDGRGTSRVVFELFCGSLRENPMIHLDRVATGDCRLLWLWANDAETRRNSYAHEYISWRKHENWFRGKMTDQSCRMYVLRAGELPLGLIRYDQISEGVVELSFSVDKQYRGRGVGSALVNRSVEDLRRSTSDIKKVEANVFKSNASSLALFRKCGFSVLCEPVIDGIPSVKWEKWVV